VGRPGGGRRSRKEYYVDYETLLLASDAPKSAFGETAADARREDSF